MWNRFLRIFFQKQEYTKVARQSPPREEHIFFEYKCPSPPREEHIFFEYECDMFDRNMFDDNAIQSHTIYFDNDPTKGINIQYCTVFGELEKEYKMYDRTGKLISSRTYRKGKLHGDSIEYNVYIQQSDGKLKQFLKYIRSYENGVEVLNKTLHKTDADGRIFDE
jgi:hypothetical protein